MCLVIENNWTACYHGPYGTRVFRKCIIAQHGLNHWGRTQEQHLVIEKKQTYPGYCPECLKDIVDRASKEGFSCEIPLSAEGLIDDELADKGLCRGFMAGFEFSKSPWDTRSLEDRVNTAIRCAEAVFDGQRKIILEIFRQNAHESASKSGEDEKGCGKHFWKVHEGFLALWNSQRGEALAARGELWWSGEVREVMARLDKSIYKAERAKRMAQGKSKGKPQGISPVETRTLPRPAESIEREFKEKGDLIVHESDTDPDGDWIFTSRMN